MNEWKHYASYFSDAPEANKQYGLYVDGKYVGSGNRSEYAINTDGSYRCHIEFKPYQTIDRIVISLNVEPNNQKNKISFDFKDFGYKEDSN